MSEELHIEKITTQITRNELKIMLCVRMGNEILPDSDFAKLTDKYSHLFGFMDWIQAYHLL